MTFGLAVVGVINGVFTQETFNAAARDDHTKNTFARARCLRASASLWPLQR